MKKFNEFIKQPDLQESLNPLLRLPIEIKSLLFNKEYKVALEKLIEIIDSDKNRRHGIYFWGNKISGQFNGVDGRKLVSIYIKWLKTARPRQYSKLNESLTQHDPLSVWIKDFQDSDAPQFKGKSKKERKDMAIAAYLSSKERIEESVFTPADDDYFRPLFDALFEESPTHQFTQNEHDVICSIWEDVLNEMFSGEIESDIESIVENAIYQHDFYLFEGTTGLPDGAQIVFGKVIKDGNQIGIVKDKKFVPLSDVKNGRNEKDVDDSKASVINVFRRMKHEVVTIAADLGESKKSVAQAFAQKDVKTALSKFGYSIKKAGEGVTKTTGLINTGLTQAFKEIEKAGGLDKLKKGAQKIDEFLGKNPVIKKMSGPLVAGALIYQWNNMSFSGDFNDDFDVSLMLLAASGDYAISDLVSSTNGAKALTQLAFGLATGKVLGNAVTFPWKLGMTAALAYTGAKKLNDSGLAKKAFNKIKELSSRKKDTIQESSDKDIARTINKLLSDPKNVDIIDAINDNKIKVVRDFFSKNIKDQKAIDQIIQQIFGKSNTRASFTEDVCDTITKGTISQIERFADMLLNKYDIDIRFTQHFADRMGDSRNSPCISIDELKDIFRKINKNEGEKIKSVKNAEAVIKDLQTQLNLPVVINYSQKNGFEVVLKTIMRKKNFKSPDRTISV